MFFRCFCSSVGDNQIRSQCTIICAQVSRLEDGQIDKVQYFLLSYNIFGYISKQKTMNNFNPFMGMYYQIWVVPSVMPNGNTFFTPVSMYPQIVQPQPTNCATSLSLSTETEKPPEIKEVPIEKTECKSEKDQVVEKACPDKNTVQIQSNITKQQSTKNNTRKPKRPLTYLTQKAFYMRHKLKGKQKSGNRILRRRPKTIQQKVEKNIEPQKLVKKVKEEQKTKKKKVIITKDLQKQKKIVVKIKSKPITPRQNCDDFAVIPKLISGVAQLNQFCGVKIQNLMCRQINKDQN